MAYDLGGTGDGHQSLAAWHRHEVASRGYRLQCVGWVGAVGTVLLGIVLFGEPVNAARVISFALIVAGIVRLKLSSPA
jgi:EamA domain-containing membrane protein RarD